MGLFIQDTWMEIFLLITTFIVFVVNYFHKTYNYWTRKGVPTIRPKFPLGNTNILFPRSFSVGTLSKRFYDEFKRQGHRFGGVYLVTAPNLVIVDPELIKDIMGKDFQHFVDRGFYYNKKGDPLSAHLFAIDGMDWKNLRVKLTPTFTSGKMKMMFHSVIECVNNMKEAIDKSVGEDIDIKEMLGRFTTDVIGCCAFGIECNSFKYPDAEFRAMGHKIFQPGFLKSIKAFFAMNLPNLALQLGVKTTSEDIAKFFKNIVAGTVKLRKEKNIRRNDFLQILMDLEDSANFTIGEMAAQVFLFFIAGFETSSTAMTFGLYELARNPDVQKKLREEICQVLEKYDNKIIYESLNEMKYLEQVLDETLRMYPPLPNLNRRCTKNYTLRDTNVVVEEGTSLLISALGLHMDPEYYPDPEKFDPERFNEENKNARHPFVHLPFGDGPRNCIGLRFGLMQSKIGIITVIKNFHLSVSPLTKPVEFNPRTFLLSSKNNVYLKAEKV
ncbi:cytochrome P450 6a2-like [Zophobas morio]|uniref:cytochrome P450 6a2-like n=1 Tax=Zophobas morio TaxID=2755281 RepID=UPI003083DA90